MTEASEYYELHPAWEICVDDGPNAILFSIYGEIIRLGKEHAALLQHISCGRFEASVLRDSAMLGAVQFLVQHGALRMTTPGRPELDECLRERFDPVADVFDQHGADGRSRWMCFQRLRQARITIIGAGGVGSMCAVMLASSGVGFLRIVDPAVPKVNNLTRQLFYTRDDVEQSTPKVLALKERINSITEHTLVDACCHPIESIEDSRRQIFGADVVILTADKPRMVLPRWVNTACVDASIPLIYTFVDRVGPFYIPGTSACYSCLESHWRHEIGPLYDKMVGDLNPDPKWPSFVAGPVQSANAIFMDVVAYLTGSWHIATLNKMIAFEHPVTRVIDIPKRPSCPACA